MRVQTVQPPADDDTAARRLEAYLYRHVNRRSGYVELDRGKLARETGITSEEQLGRAASLLMNRKPQKWGFTFETGSS